MGPAVFQRSALLARVPAKGGTPARFALIPFNMGSLASPKFHFVALFKPRVEGVSLNVGSAHQSIKYIAAEPNTSPLSGSHPRGNRELPFPRWL
jgi:hypothetical protein